MMSKNVCIIHIFIELCNCYIYYILVKGKRERGTSNIYSQLCVCLFIARVFLIRMFTRKIWKVSYIIHPFLLTLWLFVYLRCKQQNMQSSAMVVVQKYSKHLLWGNVWGVTQSGEGEKLLSNFPFTQEVSGTKYHHFLQINILRTFAHSCAGTLILMIIFTEENIMLFLYPPLSLLFPRI